MTYTPEIKGGEKFALYNGNGEDMFSGLLFYSNANIPSKNLILSDSRGLWQGSLGKTFYIWVPEIYAPKGSFVKVAFTLVQTGYDRKDAVTDGGIYDAVNDVYEVTGNAGITFVVNNRYRYGSIKITTLAPRGFYWESTSPKASTLPLLDIDDDNHPTGTTSPVVTLRRNVDLSATVTYESSKTDVALFSDENDYTSLRLKNPGTTTITATMTTAGGQAFTDSYELTVTATELATVADAGQWNKDSNTFTFGVDAEGRMANGMEFVNVMSGTGVFSGEGLIGMNAYVGKDGESHLVISKDRLTVKTYPYAVRSIGQDGTSKALLNEQGVPTSGNFVKFHPTDPGILTVRGIFSDSGVKLVDEEGNEVELDVCTTTEVMTKEILTTAHNYYLYDDGGVMYVSSYSHSPKLSAGGDKYEIHGVRPGMVIELVTSCDPVIVDEAPVAGKSRLTLTDALAETFEVSGTQQTFITYAKDDLTEIQGKDYFGTNEGEGVSADGSFTVYLRVTEGSNVTVLSARAFYYKPDLTLTYNPLVAYANHNDWNDESLKEHYKNNSDIDEVFNLNGLPAFDATFEGKSFSSDFVAPRQGDYFAIGDGSPLAWVDQTMGSVKSTNSGNTIVDATVSVPVLMIEDTRGYDPADIAAGFTATAHLYTIPFPYTWDFTTGDFDTKTKALQLVNIDKDDKPYITLGPSRDKIAWENNANKFDYPENPDLPHSRLRIPVVEGMKVKIVSKGTANRVTGDSGYPLEIINVTDTRGYSTGVLDIYDHWNTQEFLAKSSDTIVIYNRSDVEVYIQSITVTAPTLEFEDGPTPEVGWSETYENKFINLPVGATLSDKDPANENDVDSYKVTADAGNAVKKRSGGTFTFNDHAKTQVTVSVTAKGVTGLRPSWGEYTMQLIDFYFTSAKVTVSVDGTSVTLPNETILPDGLPVLKIGDTQLTAEQLQNVVYTCASPIKYIDEANEEQDNNAIASLSTAGTGYTITIQNDGEVTVTAAYQGTLRASCTIHVNTTHSGGFKYTSPSIAPDASGTTTYDFAEANSDNPLDHTLDGLHYDCKAVSKSDDQPITASISGTKLTVTGSGVVRVQALDAANKLVDEFYLTVSYPIKETLSQSWYFNKGLTDADGKELHIMVYPGVKDEDGNEQNPTLVGKVVQLHVTREPDPEDATKEIVTYTYTDASETWGHGAAPYTNRISDFRYLGDVSGDNAFIVKETAGLQIYATEPMAGETNQAINDSRFSIYTEPYTSKYVYPNIGFHQSTITIPNLPKGAYVAVAWDRIESGVGNTIAMQNLLDLEGNTIHEIKYGGSVKENTGLPQGYYTFRVAEDGNVTFRQTDTGTSRIVALHVYYGNPDTNVNAEDDVNYNEGSDENFRGSGMRQQIVAYKNNADGTPSSNTEIINGVLIESDKASYQWLTNYLNFNAPNGSHPKDRGHFKLVSQDKTLASMTMDHSGNYFESDNSQYDVPRLNFNGGWGKGVFSVSVWDDNGYLVAYRQYRFTVGQRPKQTYPKTWDFRRYFDNSTVKLAESPVTPTAATSNLNTRQRLAENSNYKETTRDTDPTRTWDSGNQLKRSSGSHSYQKYGYNEYSSYYVDGAVLVCNTGQQNQDGFILEETRGLGFDISRSGGKLQWVMPEGSTGYGEASYLSFVGTITIPKVNDAAHFDDYYVFINSSRRPDGRTNMTPVASSDDYAGLTDESRQFMYRVSANSDMTITFSSETHIYGLAVTNIKKDRITPVGNYAWATESRNVNIDHTQTGFFTKHNLQTYAVKYEDYDLETATVSLTEIHNSAEQTDATGNTFVDRGYIPRGTGILLRETNPTSADVFCVPFFTPAVTTTHPAAVSNNMLRPNIDLKTYSSEQDGVDTRFLLTNIHWTFAIDGDLSKEEAADQKIIETDAAGFYRQHLFTSAEAGYTLEKRAAMNTLRANTAFLAVPTSELPVAVWNHDTNGTRRRNSIAIRDGLWTDENENDLLQDGDNDGQQARDEEAGGWYTMSGVKLDGRPTTAGLYLHGGRKVVVRATRE